MSLNDDLASLIRVRNRLANSPDDSLPMILTALLPRLLSRLDNNSVALLSETEDEELQLRSQMQAQLLGILSHGVERMRGNELLPAPWLETIVANLAQARRHVTRTMAAALLKVGIPRIRDDGTALSEILAALFRIVDQLHRNVFQTTGSPCRASLLDRAVVSWLCLDVIAQIYHMDPMHDMDLVRFDPVHYKPPEGIAPSICVVNAVMQDGAGVFDLFYDLMVYPPGIDAHHSSGLSLEGHNRIVHRRGDHVHRWTESANTYLKHLKVNCFQYSVSPLQKGLFQGPEDSLNFRRCLIMNVLMASETSKEAGRIAVAWMTDYLSRQRLTKRGTTFVNANVSVCDLPIAISLFILVLGDAAASPVLLDHHDHRALWEGLLGPRSHEPTLQRSPLPAVISMRAISFVTKHLSVTADPGARNGLALFLDLILQVQNANLGQSDHIMIHLLDRIVKEGEGLPNLEQNDEPYSPMFRKRCVDAAVSVISTSVDSLGRGHSAAGVARPTIQGRHLDDSIDRHRQSQQRRNHGIEEGIQARNVAYDLIATLVDQVQVRTEDNRFSFALPILLLVSSQNESKFALGNVVKTLDAVLKVYLQSLNIEDPMEGDEEKYLSESATLLPVLLESICCESPGVRMAALRWISQFLPHRDRFAAMYLLDFLSNDQDKEVANAASKALGKCTQPIPSIALKEKHVFRFLDTTDVSDREIIELELLDRSELVSTAYRIPLQEGSILLRDNGFSSEDTLVLTSVERTDALIASGIPSAIVAAPIALDCQGTYTCEICYCEDISEDEVYGLGCSHLYCNECWRSYMESRSDDGRNKLLNARCPSESCSYRVRASDIEAIAPSLVPAWKNGLIADFVERAREFTFCTGPDCTMIAWSIDGANGAVQCTRCNSEFCFQCRDHPHSPARCSSVQNWNEVVGDSRFWIKKNAKPCPSCNAPIEKNDGCNHIKCSQCDYDFCWICLNRLDTHMGRHECNRYDPDAGQESRDVFYSERFQAQAGAEDFAKAHLANIDSDLQKLADRRFDLQDASVDIVESSRAALLDARRFLKFSYVAARDIALRSTDLRTFESHQGTLELFVEKLSRLSESSLTALYNNGGEQAVHLRLRSLAFYTRSVKRYTERVQSITDSL